MAQLSSSPSAFPLNDIGHWAQEMSSSTELLVGRLHSVYLFRTKRPPFNHEFIVASFRSEGNAQGHEQATSYVKMERAPRRDKNGALFTADSFAPVTGNVVSKNTITISRDLSRLAPDSNELGSIHFDNPESTLKPIYVRSVLRQMMTMSYTHFSYNLFSSNCRWFARTGLDTVIQLGVGLNVTFDAKWEGRPVSVARLLKEIESELFGGRALRTHSKDTLKWSGDTTLLMQTVLGNDNAANGILPPPQTFTSLLASVGEVGDVTEISRLHSEVHILNQRAGSHLTAGDSDNALVDANQAIGLLEPHQSTHSAVRRPLGVAYFLRSGCYVEQNLFDEAIADGKRAISLLRSVNHERLARYHLELAGVYHQAGRIEEALASCEEGLKVCVPTSQELSWKWCAKDRFELLTRLCRILEERSEEEDRRRALKISLESLALWKDLHAWGDPFAVVTRELQLYSDCVNFAASLGDWEQVVKSHTLLIERLKALPQYAQELQDALERHPHLVARSQASNSGPYEEPEYARRDLLPFLTELLATLASPDEILHLPEDPFEDLDVEQFDDNAVEVARGECDSLWVEWEAAPSDTKLINQLRIALCLHAKLLNLSHNTEEMLDPLNKRLAVTRTITSSDADHMPERLALLLSLSLVYLSAGKLPEALAIDEEQVSVLRESVVSYDGVDTERLSARKSLLRSSLIKHAKLLYWMERFEEGSNYLLEVKAVHLNIINNLPTGGSDVETVLEDLVQYSAAIMAEEGAFRQCGDICALVADITRLRAEDEDRLLRCFALCIQARAELACSNPESAMLCEREASDIFPSLNVGAASPQGQQITAGFRLEVAKVLSLAGDHCGAHVSAIEAVKIHRQVWEDNPDDVDEAIDYYAALAIMTTISEQREHFGDIVTNLRDSVALIRAIGSRFETLDVTGSLAEELIQLALYEVVQGNTTSAVVAAREFARIYIDRATLPSSTTSDQEEARNAVRRFGMFVGLLNLGGRAPPLLLKRAESLHAQYLDVLAHMQGT